MEQTAKVFLYLILFLNRGPVLASSPEPALKPIGPYYALIIGNNDYQFLPHLNTATNDATSIATMLREQYGFSTSLLLNATRADILDALATYRRKLPTNSNLLIYYAGHGTNDSEAHVAYWLPIDARTGNSANWISSDDITAELRVIKSLHVLVVADSCYSGALMRGASLIDIDAELKPQERAFYLDKLEQIKSRNILASGGVEPVADGGTLGHSIFAAVVLQSLRDMDAPEFTTSSLFQKLVVRVAGRSQQTPQYSAIVNSQHDGGDFIFVRQPGKTPPEFICCTPHSSIAAVSHPMSETSRSIPADDAVVNTLGQYRTAYENRDVVLLQKLWPAMTNKNARDLQTFFQTARSVTLTCNIVGTPEIHGTDASITFTERLAYTLDGKVRSLPPHKSTMKLSQPPGSAGDTWQIDSIQ